MFRQAAAVTVVVLFSFLFLARCGDDSTSPSGLVQIRVAHLSPDAPAVDILVDGNAVLTGVPFGTVSEYISLDSGSYRIQVTPEGNPAVSVIDTEVTFNPGLYYTVAATGLLSDLQPLILTTEPVVPEEADLRFVHAVQDAPAVDVAVVGGGVPFRGVIFRDVTEYLPAPAGTYDLEVKLAGREPVVLGVPGVELIEGRRYTIFAVGTLNSIEALFVADS